MLNQHLEHILDLFISKEVVCSLVVWSVLTHILHEVGFGVRVSSINLWLLRLRLSALVRFRRSFLVIAKFLVKDLVLWWCPSDVKLLGVDDLVSSNDLFDDPPSFLFVHFPDVLYASIVGFFETFELSLQLSKFLCEVLEIGCVLQVNPLEIG